MNEKPSLIIAEATGVFLISFLCLYALIMPQALLYSHDGYYHYAMAKLLWQHPFWVDIEWLPLTILGKAGPYHHWFWHLIIATGKSAHLVLSTKNAALFRTVGPDDFKQQQTGK